MAQPLVKKDDDRDEEGAFLETRLSDYLLFFFYLEPN